MKVKFTLLFFNFVLLKCILANENLLSHDLMRSKFKYQNAEVPARDARNFIYGNADTFFRDGIIPFYSPVKRVILTPNNNKMQPAMYQLYQLNSDVQSISYMLPIAENIISEIIDPMYQNKVTNFKEPEDQKAEDGEIRAMCKGKRAQIPSPNSCSGFVNCWDTIAVEQECIKGLLFSERGFCDLPYKVECGKRPIRSKTVACVDEFSTYRDPEDCGQFSVCVHGEPVLFKCPDNLQYNENLGVCDYPYKVRCVTTRASVIPSASSIKMSMAAPIHVESSVATETSSTSAATIPFVAISREDAMRQMEEDRQLTARSTNFYLGQYSP